MRAEGLILVLGALGCSGGSGAVAFDGAVEVDGAVEGGEGGACYPNDSCNPGLVCSNAFCVEDVGASGNACYPNGTCNSGLLCFDGLFCGDPEADGGIGVADAGPSVDASRPLDGGIQVDAMMITCNDDSPLEPNDTQNTATQLGLGVQNDITLVGLAICPASDTDMFVFTLAQNGMDVAAEIEFDTFYGQLRVVLLNDNGTVIATDVAVSGEPDKREVSIANLPVGTYYVSVNSPGFNPNNYSIDVRKSP